MAQSKWRNFGPRRKNIHEDRGWECANAKLFGYHFLKHRGKSKIFDNFVVNFLAAYFCVISKNSFQISPPRLGPVNRHICDKVFLPLGYWARQAQGKYLISTEIRIFETHATGSSTTYSVYAVHKFCRKIALTPRTNCWGAKVVPRVGIYLL